MWRQYRRFVPGEFIIAGGDCSQGGNDYNATQFFSKTKLDIPLVYHSHGVAAQMTNEVYPILEKIFDVTKVRPVVAFERNNGGASEMERLAALNRLNKYELFTVQLAGRKSDSFTEDPSSTNKFGWETNVATRGDMCGDLKYAIDNRVITIYDKPTIDELNAFIKAYRAGKWQGEAEKGATDDLVMALAICWQLYQVVKPPKTQMELGQIMNQFPNDKLFKKGGFY